MSFEDLATDALRYWERRRILYNAALFVTYGITLLALGGPKQPMAFSQTLFLWIVGVAVLAVLANMCYSAVYPIDLFVQSSAYRELWRRHRWALFVLGLLFAIALTVCWAFVGSAAMLMSHA